MIVEGIITTQNQAGEVNIAPMGPIVDDLSTTWNNQHLGDWNWTALLLRPFKTSTTFRNLNETGQGVFHIVDDVELIARSAVGKVDAKLVESNVVSTPRLLNCCRFFELQIIEKNLEQMRTEMKAQIIHTQHVRDFFGLNRAMHAVLELAILATRLHLPQETAIQHEIERLQIPLDKTGGQREHAAFDHLKQYIANYSR